MLDVGDSMHKDKRYPAPKHGRGFGFTSGQAHCKDICNRFSSGRPFGKVYLTHYRCSWCDVYLLHDKCAIVKGTPRCPCCKRRVKTKTVRRTYSNTNKAC